jgi:hypothetical protein
VTPVYGWIFDSTSTNSTTNAVTPAFGHITGAVVDSNSLQFDSNGSLVFTGSNRVEVSVFPRVHRCFRSPRLWS